MRRVTLPQRPEYLVTVGIWRLVLAWAFTMAKMPEDMANRLNFLR